MDVKVNGKVFELVEDLALCSHCAFFSEHCGTIKTDQGYSLLGYCSIETDGGIRPFVFKEVNNQ